MPPKPRPFRLETPEADLADLRERLARTRFPDEPPLEPWVTGTSLSYLRALISYWQTTFDWRVHEARINRWPQYKVAMRGIDLHFIHAPGGGGNPTPLLLLHGWPGSIVEFSELIPRLTERFTVVAPSLPGFTLSFTPGQPRFGTEEMADLFAELMTEVLGYERFAAQGGDWGAFIASRLGYAHAEKLIGIHLNLLAVRRDPKQETTNENEKAYLAQLSQWLKEETGYQWIQGTRPQTLAYALNDSPTGLAAWIAEKFQRWSDCGGVIENAVSRDDLLANITLYWLSGAIGSSFWPYYARMHRPWPIPEGKTVDVPMGYAEFPKEILRPPRSLAARTYTDIRQWSAMKKGGHFAALEQPAALAAEVERFFRPLAG
ncbi:MAG TPA: epoxide hydrolase [Burkholderiales bacterium]